jgi:hypothetical protein
LYWFRVQQYDAKRIEMQEKKTRSVALDGDVPVGCFDETGRL